MLIFVVDFFVKVKNEKFKLMKTHDTISNREIKFYFFTLFFYFLACDLSKICI